MKNLKELINSINIENPVFLPEHIDEFIKYLQGQYILIDKWAVMFEVYDINTELLEFLVSRYGFDSTELLNSSFAMDRFATTYDKYFKAVAASRGYKGKLIAKLMAFKMSFGQLSECAASDESGVFAGHYLRPELNTLIAHRSELIESIERSIEKLK